jgi:hypothetical protein
MLPFARGPGSLLIMLPAAGSANTGLWVRREVKRANDVRTVVSIMVGEEWTFEPFWAMAFIPQVAETNSGLVLGRYPSLVVRRAVGNDGQAGDEYLMKIRRLKLL